MLFVTHCYNYKFVVPDPNTINTRLVDYQASAQQATHSSGDSVVHDLTKSLKQSLKGEVGSGDYLAEGICDCMMKLAWHHGDM